jgi:pyruvate dehydrogenase E1 component alpha subunit
MAAVTHESIRRAGRYSGLSLEGLEEGTIEKLFRHMLRLRLCEEALIREYHPANEMRCPVHFSVGQEAVPAALSLLLRPDDYLFSHHRSHGYYLAKSAPMDRLFAEMYGRTSGASGGKAGSQDISMPECRFYSGAILAGAIAIAVGTAQAVQQQGGDHIVVTGFGEAATEEGVFWEAIHLAALHRLPVVFSCENNKYSAYSPQLKRQTADSLEERAASFGVPSCSVFGNDVAAVYRAFHSAVETARRRRGPTFVQAYTYRWKGHVGPQDDETVGYRDDDEIQFWKSHCPLRLLQETLEKKGLFNAAAYAGWKHDIEEEITAAFAFAKSSPFPAEADWQALNYATQTPLADRLLVDEQAVGFNQYQAEAVPGPY